MNEDQFQTLIDVLNALIFTIAEASEKVSDAIEGIYTPSNEGLERRMDKLIDAINDAAERIT